MNNMITRYQSAYRNQHNTQTALHRVVDDWLYNMSDGNLTGECSFDITKCFDTSCHLRKCLFMDIKSMLQNGFNHIFTKGNKWYHVKINYVESVNFRWVFHRDLS